MYFLISGNLQVLFSWKVSLSKEGKTVSYLLPSLSYQVGTNEVAVNLATGDACMH